MLHILTCITGEHDLRLVALAAGLCLFASHTALRTFERGGAASGARRIAWLLLAGSVTGTGIWATHFTAMSGYMAEGIRVDPQIAMASYGATVALSIAGWAVALGAGRVRGLAGGILVGVGLATAHYLDMYALTIGGGRVTYDLGLTLVSILSGLGLSGLAGFLVSGLPAQRNTVAATLALTLGVLSLHFISMAAAQIAPGGDLSLGAGWQATDFTTYVILAAAGLLGAAYLMTYYDRQLAALATADNRRLGDVVSALMHSEERYRLASRVTNDVIWDWNHRTDRIEWSEGILTNFGYREALEGTTHCWWESRVHPDDLGRVLEVRFGTTRGTNLQWNLEYRFRKADGDYAHVACRAQVIRDSHGAAVRSIGAILDISDRKTVEEELRWAALHDSLTGLPNRRMLYERLNENMKDALATRKSVGLILIDIDNFKTVNDSFGHHAGDEVLQAVAAHLTAGAPRNATVARLGGDEFAIALPSLSDGDCVATIAETLLAGLNSPFAIGDQTVIATASSGAAQWPQDGVDAEELLRNADLALYAAKADGRNLTRQFSSGMRQVAQLRSSMLAGARTALDTDRIIPFYQPQVQLSTGRVIGFEALMRWHHPRLGLQSPSSIAAAFKDKEVARQITDRMIGRVLVDIRGWLDDGLSFGRIAINAAPADFHRGDFADRLLTAANAAGVAPSCLELEVTETVFLDPSDDGVVQTLREISRAGITIALDDFGTGYASLSHLKKFPVNVLKIDGSFVAGLEDADHHGRLIVRAIIGLGSNLGIESVAEGVESVGQARLLEREGCDFGQGYLFSRAVAECQVPRIIARGFAGEFDLENLEAPADLIRLRHRA
jgi:diguanylate cyclase (GGDEF)-like protein/PAS domain S-box-containing protein